MRKLTQRRAVDYTSTVVRYMQVLPTLSWLKTELRLPKPWITMQTQATGHKINVFFLLCKVCQTCL
ncbi:hypothetical protein ES332_D10G084800v1 [Gossypium tomentosum]|uniref:Uncharacterized protein n=1 Tax=Gossypium tomentosum TaxID=34277 RepID=A0A5D2J2N5_GOSTO|nr:hypothetical protein ES332_D10G084800v1 [Gossypium tomentosum]TYH48695.1 hypothetical protein ES332_D10G084800v1 [Gossypium tomentosum]